MPGEETDTDARERERYLSRRKYMMAAGSLAGVGVLAGNAAGQTTTQTTQGDGQQGEVSLEEQYPGLRILSPEPENAEAASKSTYRSFVTPRTEHYIRNHYPTPDIDASEWTVSLTGMVDEEVELSMDEIRNDYSTETVTHTMQCSGNGRSYFEPQVGGNQWTFGAVGNTVWTGTPVGEILEAYGANTESGTWLSVMGGDAPDGEDIFTRSIPMEKVMEDCLLAYEMNGRPMNGDHGFPVRLLVPGWFGNNNVKWVDRMHVMEMMVFGDQWEEGDQQLYTHWQQYSYRIIPEDEELQQNRSIDVFDTQEQMGVEEIGQPYLYDQMVKSIIGYPSGDETVAPGPGGQIEVVGVAWAGDDAVQTVEVSTDGGESWNEAEFFGPQLGPYAWRQFRYVWSDPDQGEHTLYARATDEQDRTQPATISSPEEGLQAITDDKYPWNVDGYGATAYEPLGVTVTVQSEGGTETTTTEEETTTTEGETTTTTTGGS
ncbi:sulfite oxidase [Halomicrococcus sp. NG-SE-24]|uniref:sulfite oxidase n=1 Tax=Halomicrococcus sp. NG-SE-24 TaxID=3436928 RepID=UPI003D970D77